MSYSSRQSSSTKISFLAVRILANFSTNHVLQPVRYLAARVTLLENFAESQVKISATVLSKIQDVPKKMFHPSNGNDSY